MNLTRDWGLCPEPSLQEIKQAYRRLAKSAHPDLNPGRGDDFMAHLNRAYQTLSSRFKGSAAPYEFQEFSFGAHARPAREAAKTATESPRAQSEPPRPEPAFAAQAPAPAPAVAPAPLGPADFKAHFGPLDLPRPEAAGMKSSGPEAAQFQAPFRPGCRLTGLDRKQGSLVYRLEVTGTPEKAVLPVRTLHGCSQCGGSGTRPYGPGGLCPGCGGAGKIVKPKNMEVTLPSGWADGQLVQAGTAEGQTVFLELRRSPNPGRA